MYDFQTPEPAPEPVSVQSQSALQRIRSGLKIPSNLSRSKRTALGIGVGSLLLVSLAAASLGGRGPSLAKRAQNLLVGGETIELSEMPTKLAEVYCEAVLTCNSESEIAARFEGAVAVEACVEANALRFREQILAGIEESEKRGTVKYNAAFASQCLDQLAAKKCGILGYSLFEVCTDTFVGQAEESCLHEFECGPSERCEMSQDCPGTCVPKSHLGQPCRLAQDCVGGLYCSELSFSCAAISQEEEACDGDETAQQCTEGLYCNEGKCVSNEKNYDKAEGEWCGDEGLCKKGLSCTVAFTQNECMPIARAGQPCRVGVPSHCEAGHFCTADPQSGVWEGTCEEKLQEGSSCSAAEQCDPSLECIEGACTKMSTMGEACSDPSDCYSDNCVSGKCEPVNSCPSDAE